jgi:hypothetical protein
MRILRVDGDFAQLTTGTLDIDIYSSGPGTGHDQLAISGSAAFSGNLILNFPYTPVIKDTPFPIITYESHTGKFDNITIVGLDSAYYFEVEYKQHALEITIRNESYVPDWKLIH